MSSIGRVCNDSNSFFLNKFDLVEIMLRYATENNGTVVEMRLNEGKVQCFQCCRS